MTAQESTTHEELVSRAQRHKQRQERGHLKAVEDELVQAGDAVDPWATDPRRFRIGIENFDHAMQPRRASEFMVIGGLPGDGKTSLLEQSAVTNAEDGHKVIVFSLEMLSAVLQGKMLGRHMGVNQIEFERHRSLGTKAYQNAVDWLRSLPLKFFRPPEGQFVNVQQVFAIAERHGADMIALDYAAKLGGWQPGNVAREIVAYTSARLKHNGMFMLMLAQLDQSVLTRKNVRPTLADFEDSKAFAKEATNVVLIHRPFSGIPHLDTVAELIVAKSRSLAPKSKPHVHWHGDTTTFFSMTPPEEALARCCAPKPKAPKKGEKAPPRDDTEMSRAEEDALLAEAPLPF